MSITSLILEPTSRQDSGGTFGYAFTFSYLYFLPLSLPLLALLLAQIMTLGWQ